MTCAVATGCGESSDSSAAESTAAESTADESSADESSEESSADESSDAESSADESSDGGETVSDLTDTLAYNYTQQINSGNYAIDMVVNSDYTGEAPMKIEIFGDDYHMYYEMMGMSVDMYLVDNQFYMLDSSTKSYSVEEMEEGMTAAGADGASSFALEDGFEFVSSEETDDGLVCETFNYNASSDLGLELESGVTLEDESSEDMTFVYKYYFDKDTKELKKIDVDMLGMTESVVINSFSTDVAAIELPDLTDWTLIDLSTMEGDISEELDLEEELTEEAAE